MKERATLAEIKACECCYNCRHWLKDASLMRDYTYNHCPKQNLLTSAGWLCNEFESSKPEALLPNVFGREVSA